LPRVITYLTVTSLLAFNPIALVIVSLPVPD
jgi:hypothetical protein